MASLFARNCSVLLVVLSTQLLLAGHALASSTYDCSNVERNYQLADLDQVCLAAVPNKGRSSSEAKRLNDLSLSAPTRLTSEGSSKSALAKLDTIELCTCNILRHSFVWQALLTPELDNFFHATWQLVLKQDEKLESDALSKAGQLQQPRSNWYYQNNGQTGARAYFFERLENLFHHMLSDKPEIEMDSESFNQNLMKIFAENYLKPDTMELPYLSTGTSGQASTTSLRTVITNTCNSLMSKFEKVSDFLDGLSRLADNSRYTFQVATHDETLFKVLVGHKVCHFLQSSDELVL